MNASKVRELQQQIDESRALIGKAVMLLDEAEATLAQTLEDDEKPLYEEANEDTSGADQPPIFRLHS